MDIKKQIFTSGAHTGVSGFFSAYGSFGVVDGADRDLEKQKATENGYEAEYDAFSVTCTYEELGCGVISRADKFTAKEDLTLNRYTSRIFLENSDYEVYTQFSCWQTESKGGWQPLITGVELESLGLQTTNAGVPMVALRNRGNGKIFVLHLLPNAQWKIKVTKTFLEQKSVGVLIETGINDKGLRLKVTAGETIEMPRLFLYEANSLLDLDAWRLHTVYNRLYPRKRLPVLFNTWMLNFQTLDIEDIFRQIDCAADLGVELFAIDAGWFGATENWFDEVGIWQENPKGGFFGRMKEVSDYVRSRGMGFGLWVEPERANTGTPTYKEHPEYYKLGSNGNAFLDFANPDARKYITDVVRKLAKDYGVKFFKFDLNAPLAYDETGDGFYRYFQGVRQFLADIRAENPDLHITNCSGGGNRMELANGMYYDSIWSSDNQSPIYGFRIIKDTALRLPPCHIERWDVRRYVDGIPKYGSPTLVQLPLSCNGANWENVHNVTPRYTHSFLTGGPVGFSTDIAAYPAEEKRALKDYIRQFKQDRDFYKNATFRILHDTESLTAVQYADEDLNRLEVQVFSNVLNQDVLTVYPVADPEKTYRYKDTLLTGRALMNNGITLPVADIDCVTAVLTAED